MQKVDPDFQPLRDPNAVLEQSLIEEFLLAQGHDIQALKSRDDPQARAIMVEAAQYAAGRLAEYTCRAHYVHDIHGTK